MNKQDKIWIALMDLGHRLGCHQMPERSFFYKGYQFPVCARCTGVFIGEIITIILLLFKIHFSIIVSIILLLIMGFDWFVQYINLLNSNNYRRLFTGVCGGIGLTYIYYHIIAFIIRLILRLIIKI